MGCEGRDSGLGIRERGRARLAVPALRARGWWSSLSGRKLKLKAESVMADAALADRSQRLQTQLIAAAVSPAISGLCRTITWKVEGAEHYDEIVRSGRQPIIAFWHGRILPAAWYFRNRGIVALTSANFDGQWIARVLEHFGNQTVAGSTSRGGMRAHAGVEAEARVAVRSRSRSTAPADPRGLRSPARHGSPRRPDIRSCRSTRRRVPGGRSRAGTARRCRSHSAQWRLCYRAP